ncbi:hypothetical protein [Pseudooceanicola sp.]|uniref:hypothetical protein n=1 Tax=Pseudooceanicola sp. TaxID=1914328 RepID=UPI0035C6B060
MPLISNVLGHFYSGGVPSAASSGSQGQSRVSNPEDNIFVDADEESTGSGSATSGVSSANYGNSTGQTDKADEEIIASVLAAFEPKKEADKGAEEDFSRRAAMSTQAKLTSEALFEALETESFSQILESRQYVQDAYGKSNAQSRYAESAKLSA